MTITEFVSWLEGNRDNARAKSFIAAIDAATPETAEAALAPQLDPAKVKEYLSSKDAYPVLQPYIDKAKQEAVLRFRENDLPKLQEEYFATKYSEKHPPQSEAEKQLAEIQRKFAEMEREKKIADIKAKALQVAAGKKLPADIIDVLHLDDEEPTLARIEKLAELMTNQTNAMVEERMKGVKPEPRTAGTVGKVGDDAPVHLQIQSVLESFNQKGA
jgi:hypothetical protein